MEPHFGAGAGQSIEVGTLVDPPRTISIHRSLHRQDAFVLGRLLTHELTHRGNVADALKTYEDVRLPFANSIVQQSQDVGRYFGFQRLSKDGPAPPHGSPEELEYVRKGIEDGWEWQSESAWVWGDAEERWRTKCGARPKL
jgi:salicylate hydroxylase